MRRTIIVGEGQETAVCHPSPNITRRCWTFVALRDQMNCHFRLESSNERRQQHSAAIIYHYHFKKRTWIVQLGQCLEAAPQRQGTIISGYDNRKCR